MESDDDPEARIRELERPLAEQARRSQLFGPASPELGTPSPGYRPAPAARSATASPTTVLRNMAIGIGLLVVFGSIAGYPLSSRNSAISGHPSTISRTVPAPGHRTALPTEPRITHGPTVAGPAPSGLPQGQPAMPIQIAGVSGNRTLDCNGGAVNISGVSNTVTITGQCQTITVSGIDNSVTVDAAEQIVTSGILNHVVYHSGTPEITNQGGTSTVTRG